MKFANRLKQIRKEKGLTMQEMGDKLNITRQGYSRYEDENAPSPQLDKVIEIANALNVSIGYLLGITDIDDKPIKHNESVIYQDNDFKLLSDTRKVIDEERLIVDLVFDTERN